MLMKSIIKTLCHLLLVSIAAHATTVEANRVVEITLRSSSVYKNPFVEIELDAVVTQPDGKELRVPMFWAGENEWRLRYASNQLGKHVWRTECTDTANSGLHGISGEIEVVAYEGDNPLYRHGPLRVSTNQRYLEQADGTPFFWLGDTWWKGLCKRLTWSGFQQLTANRRKKGFTVVQIVLGTYPDELGLLRPSWENEGGMPYLKQDFSQVNPKYFDYSDRRIEHLIDNGIMPGIVGGWGRAVTFNAVGLEGYKRHYRNLAARYGAYPVIFFIGGETHKKQGPWYKAAEYLNEVDGHNRPLANLSSHLRHALEGHAVFDFDIQVTGHNSWTTVNQVLFETRKSFNNDPLKPFVSGESCYELHMQQNPAYLQRYQFWALMLAGAAGHTYGAAGIWHMGTPQEHGNWGGWSHQPYDLTTWDEGMQFPGSAQLGRCKALLQTLPWHRFKEHPEWVDKGRFAAGIPGAIRVIYQPIRGVYKWDGITLHNLEPGTWSAFYFDPVSGRRYDLDTHTLSGTWKSPNVPSPQDWVLVMRRKKG